MKRAWSAIRSADLLALIGVDEIVLLCGIAFATVGIWSLSLRFIGSGWPSLVAPGAIWIWISLPSRSAFITSHNRESAETGKGKRS